MFVIPAPGLVVRDPETRIPLPVEGADVPATEYWERRIKDGDAFLQPAPAKKKTKDTAPESGSV